jgi:hypothetical protein
MHRQYTLTLSLTEKTAFGEPVARMAVDIPDMVMSERMVSEIKSALGPMGYSFDDVVKIMKKREWRRKELQILAVQLFGQLADYLEDVEGWHGEDRQDKAKAARERR